MFHIYQKLFQIDLLFYSGPAKVKIKNQDNHPNLKIKNQKLNPQKTAANFG